MLAIGMLALGVRLAYGIQYGGHPLGRILRVDEIVYWERARAILGGQWLPDKPFFQDPLIHYMLAGLMSIVGTESRDLRVAMVSIGALTPVLTYWAGRWGLGRAEGILGGLALAVYCPLVFADGQLEKEGIGALVAALALLVTTRAADARRVSHSATLAGFLWGAMALLRANALLVGPIGVAWWLARTELSLRSRWVGALAFLSGFALALAPVTLINASVSRPREFILTTTQGGSMFYTGNGPEANGLGDEPSFVDRDPHREADDFAAEAERRTGRRLSPGEVSSFWMRQGL